jgi:hypothetical protein
MTAFRFTSPCDREFATLIFVIPNPALSGEESAFACTLLNAAAAQSKAKKLALARHLEQKQLKRPANASVLIRPPAHFLPA